VNSLTIFDADFLLYTATMGNKVLDDEDNPKKDETGKFIYTEKTLEEVYSCANDIINNILRITKADYFVGYLGGCSSFRYSIYPEYKGTRSGIKPLYFKELKEYLVEDNNINFILTQDGLEADDAVNIVRNNLQNDYNCTIVSSDKDLIKSISGNYCNTRNLELINTSREAANRFFWESMIVGDAVDNIKCLAGRGIKFATKILDLADELNTPYSMEVFNQYILYYKDDKLGIEEFYKNFKCLKILDNSDNFEMPKLNQVIREDISEWG